jgi:hypothetical protein
MGPDDFKRCMDENVRTGIAPKRGQLTHPSRCWRVFNVLFQERKAHADAYAPLFKAAVRTSVTEGELDLVKASLSAMPAAP